MCLLSMVVGISKEDFGFLRMLIDALNIPEVFLSNDEKAVLRLWMVSVCWELEQSRLIELFLIGRVLVGGWRFNMRVFVGLDFGFL